MLKEFIWQANGFDAAYSCPFFNLEHGFLPSLVYDCFLKILYTEQYFVSGKRYQMVSKIVFLEDHLAGEQTIKRKKQEFAYF